MQNFETHPESPPSATHTSHPASGLKVSIGSGNVQIQDFIRVDIDASTQPDRVMDARKLEFAPGSVDVLYASHVLEHFQFETTPEQSRWSAIVELLSLWRKCLSEKGSLYLCVPDLERLSQLLVDHKDHTDIQRIALDTIYGGSRSEYDVHYCGFTKSLLTELLLSAGFQRVEEFTPFVKDESSHLLLGKSISLNLVAHNGTTPNHLQIEKPPIKAEADSLQHYMRVADERRAEILILSKEISTLSQACDERLALIHRLQGEIILMKNRPNLKLWLGKLSNKVVNLTKK